MAKLYFDASDTSLNISNSNTEVIGLSGTGVQSVTIAEGVTGVTLRQNVEKLVLNGASSAFKYQQAGGTLKIYKTDGTTLIATVPVQGGSTDIDGDGTLITFTNGTASAKLTSGVMSLGGTTVSTTIGDVTPTLSGGTTPITFSLDKDSYDVTEGQTLTFTIKASAPVQSATSVRYSIVGDKSVVGQDATAGTDFSPASASLSFASGESEKTVTITVPNDGNTEGFEGMKISLLSSTFGFLDSALATIEDGPELAKTAALTTSGDSFQGSANDDTINATLSYSGTTLDSTTNTLSSNDTIAGGLGVDTLQINARGTLGTGGPELPAPIMTGIEKVLVTSSSIQGTGGSVGTFGVDFSNHTDGSLTTIGTTTRFSDANSRAFFKLVPTNVDVVMQGQSDLEVKFASSVVSGTADTLDLILSGVGTDSGANTASGGVSAFGIKDGGIETLHITSQTNANYLELVDDVSGRIPGLRTVTIDGDQNLFLDLNAETGTGSITVNATDFSGNLTLDGISTGAVTLQGGAGNDTFSFTSSSLSSGDSVVGGGGTDTLKLPSTVSADSALSTVSSIESLYLASGASFTGGSATDAAGIVTIKEGTGAADTVSITLSSGFDNAITVELYGTGDTVNASGSQASLTVKVSGTGWTNDTLTAGTGTGTTDVLTITADGSSGTLGSSVTHFEKIVIAAGTGSLNLTTVDLNLASGKTLAVDASALTTSTGLTFVGSGEADGAFSITGSSGIDTLTLGAGNDTVDAGAGADIIYASGSGNDSILGGDGNDTINMGSGGLSSGDTIVGGSGTDTLIVADTSVSSAQFTNVSEIEILKLSASSVTLSSNISFTTFDLTDTGTQTTLTLSTTGYTNATTVQLGSGDTVVNSANVSLTGTINENDASGTINFTGGTGVDTLVITAGSGTGDLTLATGAKIDVITVLDGTGAGADISLVATGYATSLRVDASELDAGATGTGLEGTLDEKLTFNGSGASGAFTVLGGGGEDSITLGSGADSVDGGLGNDTILGWGGNDKILGNDGDDTLISGTGNDSINGGAGNDRIIMGDGTGAASAGYITGDDTIAGGEGNDTLRVAATGSADVNDLVFLNVSSIETLELSTGSTGTISLDTRAQTAGINTIKLSTDGTNQTVNVSGFSNSVTFDFNGNTGNASLNGGRGDDIFLVKGAGTLLSTDDSLNGGDGADIIRLDNGTGTVSIGIGDGVKKIERIEVVDNSTGSAGANVTISNDAFDSGDTVVITASELDATEAFTLSFTGSHNKAAFSVIGGLGNDTLSGGGRADNLSGGVGNDSLNGGAGNDTVNGGDGADTLVASDGNDTLTGGAGNDIFFFGTGSSTRDNDKIDTVADFTAGDKLVFDDVARTLTGGSLDLSSGLNKGTAGSIGDAAGLTTAAGQYVYLSVSKQLAVDLNGDGQLTSAAGDYMVILTDSTGISASDVLINFDVTLSGSATATGGAGTDTLIFSTTGLTGTISGFESVIGSTGIDTVNLGSTGADTITVFATGGATQFGGTGGVDVISLASGGSDTIVFGTGALGSGADFGLTMTGFFGTGANIDYLNLDALVTGTSFLNTGGTSDWFNLTGTTASGNFSSSGEGVIFLYGSTGGTDGHYLATGDITTGAPTAAGTISLGTNKDYVLVVATGEITSSDNIYVYHINSNDDGTAGTFSVNDIKLIGTVDLQSSDAISTFSSANIRLS